MLPIRTRISGKHSPLLFYRMVYGLAVAAIFKNEEHSMVEWIEHYLRRGAEHFYLIDDGSTDRSVEFLKPYIDAGQVTLLQPN